MPKPPRPLRPFPGAELRLWPGWLDQVEADRQFALLRRALPWREQAVRLFGREVMQPRLVSWCASEGVRYSYSGIVLEGEGWAPPLEALRRRVEEATEIAFNSVLCNLYRDGRDSMGWHADNEPELGPEPPVASLSLGVTRDFLIKPRRGAAPAQRLPLAHGDLLLMAGRTQHEARHALPKRRGVTAERINLTFRRILK